MRKIVAIGGVPGTGKTTLIREFMKDYEWEYHEPAKLVACHYCKELDLWVIGKYNNDEVFAGTDKLSMGVQPPLQAWIQGITGNVLFEGDRIFNQSFLEFCSDLPDTQLDIIYIDAPEAELQRRYAERGSNQSETFLKGRHTKVGKLKQNIMLSHISSFYNNTSSEEQKVIVDHIRKELV